MSRLQTLPLLVTLAALIAIASSASTGGKRILEILVVMDPRAVKAWEVHAHRAGNTVEQEVLSMYAEVNRLYEDFNVELRLKNGKILYTEEDILPAYKAYGENNNLIDVDISLVDFKEWMNTQNYEFDVAIMMGSYDLSVGENTGINGVAWEWGACTKERGYSLIENTYDMRQVLCIAHEIMHLLGSKHDTNEDSIGCSDEDGYIMTAVTGTNQANFVQWSDCTFRYLKTFISSDNAWCLKETASDSTPFRASYQGEIIDADETCRRREGVFSHATRFAEISSKLPVCRAIFCESGLEVEDNMAWRNDYSEYFTPNGMPCGEGQRCIRGNCVDDNTSHLVDGCPLQRDIPFFSNAPWDSCYEAMKRGDCQYEIVRSMCCHACSQAGR